MMTVLSILGWLILFGGCFLFASVFFGIHKESKEHLKVLKNRGFDLKGPLELDQPTFFRAIPDCKPESLVEAPFSRIPALYFHTSIDSYHGRKKENVFNQSQCVPFEMLIADQSIQAPTKKDNVDWMAAKIHAYQGLASGMSEREKRALAELGIDGSNSRANPMKAVSVEEELLPLCEEIWVFGKVVRHTEDVETSQSSVVDNSNLMLKAPSDTFESIIAMSQEDVWRQMRYKFYINLSAAVFCAVAPFFFLMVKIIH